MLVAPDGRTVKVIDPRLDGGGPIASCTRDDVDAVFGDVGSGPNDQDAAAADVSCRLLMPAARGEVRAAEPLAPLLDAPSGEWRLVVRSREPDAIGLLQHWALVYTCPGDDPVSDGGGSSSGTSGVTPDAGSNGGADSDSGCGCSAVGAPVAIGASLSSVVFALMLAARRRRR